MSKEDIIIAAKYSSAAFCFAEKRNSIEAFLADFQKIYKLASDDFLQNLSNPFLSKNSIIDSVNWICENAKVSKNVKHFITIVALNKRLYLIKKIYQNFVNKINEKNGLENIEVISSSELEKENKLKIEKQLKNSFSNNKIEFSYKIDKKILGGLVIKKDNIIIDSSLKNYLNKLESHLVK
jgi:F-type H+-transporting ATPase subunit delta